MCPGQTSVNSSNISSKLNVNLYNLGVELGQARLPVAVEDEYGVDHIGIADAEVI